MRLQKLLPLLCLAAATASAQTMRPEPEAAFDTAWLEPIVVTGTRTPHTLSDAPVVTRIITRRDIELINPTSVEELLQASLSDLQFGYAMNQQVSLNMQGLGGGAVLFLVDGERLSGETLDNPDYNRLILSDIDRIEVVKGASSAIYGSNAAGAVVNIITRAADADRATAGAQIGPNGLQRYTLSAAFRRSHWQSSTQLQHHRRNAVHLADVGELTTLYATSHSNVHQRVAYSPNERLTLSARAGYYFRQRHSAPTSDDRYRDFSGGLKAEWHPQEQSLLTLAYAYDEYDKSAYSSLNGLDVLNYSNVQHTVRALLTHRLNSKLELTAGGDLMRDYLLSYQFADGESHHQYTAAAFLQTEWMPCEQVDILAALRYDYYSIRHLDQLSPRLSVMYRPGDLTLRATWARGFRAPTLKEMYMDFDMASIFTIYGNPSLQAETAQNASLSAEYRHKRLGLGATAHYNKIYNQIATVWNQPAGAMVYQNMASMQLMGADLTASYLWASGFELRGSYTYSHNRNTAPDSPLMSAVRPHSATAQLSYSHAWKNYRLNVSLNGRLLSEVTTHVYADLSNPSLTSEATYPAYMLWKLTVHQQMGEAVEVSLTVDNLLNYIPDYYYNSTPPTTGTTLMVGLTVDFVRLYKRLTQSEAD